MSVNHAANDVCGARTEYAEEKLAGCTMPG
jgi:hypothetical protein